MDSSGSLSIDQYRKLHIGIKGKTISIIVYDEYDETSTNTYIEVPLELFQAIYDRLLWK